MMAAIDLFDYEDVAEWLAFEKMLSYANHVGLDAEQISRGSASSKGTSPRR